MTPVEVNFHDHVYTILPCNSFRAVVSKVLQDFCHEHLGVGGCIGLDLKGHMNHAVQGGGMNHTLV